MPDHRIPLVSILLLAVIGLLLLGGSVASAQGPTPATVTATSTPTVQATKAVTSTVAVTSTATTVPPSATKLPPTATLVPPTATKVPPTATKVPPTSTPVQPTATATKAPATATKVPPPTTQAPVRQGSRAPGSGPAGNWLTDFTLFNLSGSTPANSVVLTRFAGCSGLSGCSPDAGTSIPGPSGGSIGANGSFYCNPGNPSDPCAAGFPAGSYSGSIMVSSGSPLAGTVTLANGLTGAAYASDAYSAVTNPNTVVYLPIMLANLGGASWNTRVYVQNAGASPANVTIHYSGAGAPGDTTITGLPANQSAFYDLASSLVTGFNGSATVTSTNGQNLAVIVEEYKAATGGTLMAYNGIPQSDADTTVYLPGYIDQGVWLTDLTIVNTGGSPATNTNVTFAGSGASLMCTVPANGSVYLNRTAGVPAGCSGSYPTNYYGAAKISTTSGQKLVAAYNIGDAGLGNHRTEAYVAFPTSAAAQTIIVPLIENRYGSGWLTTFSVQSVDGTTPSLSLYYSGNMSPLCNPCAGNMSGASKTFFQDSDGHVPTGFLGGVRIVSNKNIVVIADQDNKANPSILGGDTAAGFVGFIGLP